MLIISRTKLFLASILLVLCGALLSCGNLEIDEPAKAAEEWYTAVLTMDALKADELVCRAERETFREEMSTGGALIFAFELFVGPMEVEVDTSEVQFKTIEQKGDWAVVTSKGEVRTAIETNVNSEEINERWFMTLEDNEWKWCGQTVKGLENRTNQDNILDETLIRERALLAINNIETYRMEATTDYKNDESRNGSHIYLKSHDKFQWIGRYSNGEKHEMISSQEKTCGRSDDELWECNEGSYESPVSGALAEFRRILKIPIVEGVNEVLDQDYIENYLGDEKCYLLYIEENPSNNWKDTTKLCLDSLNYYPVIYIYEGYHIVNNEDVLVSKLVSYFYDVNKPIEITLPEP